MKPTETTPELVTGEGSSAGKTEVIVGTAPTQEVLNKAGRCIVLHQTSSFTPDDNYVNKLV